MKQRKTKKLAFTNKFGFPDEILVVLVQEKPIKLWMEVKK